MKRLAAVLIGIIVVFIVLLFFKDALIKTSIEKGTQVVTGLTLKIRSLRVGILNTVVGIKGLELFNPPGFQDRIMLDMPEIFVDYNLPSILKGTIHLNEMRIDIKKFVVVKNAQGALNLDSLKVVRAQKEGKAPEVKGKGSAGGAAIPDVRIDLLRLKVSKVVYKDYSKGGQPQVREFDVNIDETFTNVTDPYKLVSLIVVRTLMSTTIGELANFDLGGLQNTVGDTLASAQKVMTRAVAAAGKLGVSTETAEKTVEIATQVTAETAKQAGEVLEKTTEGLKGAFDKLPFGSKK
ncbi:MAG: hypothetical protein ABIJ27_04080 [Candidatus Omnitrophota bacterium]